MNKKLSLITLTLFFLLTFTTGSSAINSTPPSSVITKRNYSITASNSNSSWLSYVNYYRRMANLPKVAENSSWSAGGYKHSRYMVKNDFIGHTEDKSNQWYSPEGLEAAQSSNLVLGIQNDRKAIDIWMNSPFHAVGIIDPSLHKVGFGSYYENGRGAAALDIIRGMGGYPASVEFPVKWPAGGRYVRILSYDGGEWPNPLTSTPSYKTPVGLPIIIQLGKGNITPKITSHSFKRGSMSLDHSIFDETNYKNPTSSEQDLGRAVLNSRDAVVIIPKEPLRPGQSYTASITSSGSTYSWTLKTALKTYLSWLISSKVVKPGSLVTIKGKLLDMNKRAVKQKKIAIYVKGKRIRTARTNSKGIFSLRVRIKETTIFKASFPGGTAYYPAASNNFKVKVN